MAMRVWMALGLAIVAGTAMAETSDSDPYLWLSKIHDAKALAWVAEQNARSDAALTRSPLYAAMRGEILASLDSRDRIPLGTLDHGQVYNFWQDGGHVRGLWRRTSVADYRAADPKWEVLLDLDRFDAEQKKGWVFQGAECAPGAKRCLVRLSPDGGDKAEYFEFDPATHGFPAGGFHVPLAKSRATYLDDDTLLVAGDFGPGSLTKSGYPRIVKRWTRGTAFADAKTVFEGHADDVEVDPEVFRGPYGTIALVRRGLTFFTSEYAVLLPDGTALRLPVPEGAELRGVSRGFAVFTLRHAWKTGTHSFPEGALVAFDLARFVKTRVMPPVALLYAPGPHGTVETVAAGRDAVYAAIFENITGSIHVFSPDDAGAWSQRKLALPAGGTVTAVSADDWSAQAYFTYESFLVPPTLYEAAGDGTVQAIKAQKPLFDASPYVAEQFWAKSKDGTEIPYFLVHARDAKGPRPTVLYSYGGFELSLFPWYWNDGHRPLDAGQVWLKRGGAVAVANIRGGGEFGPAWHQATLKYHHKRAFEDFAGVAQDLIARGFATPKTLGIVGASNGGLLVSATMVAHPELFGAVVCQRPLIDMLRYTRFGAGMSWVDEYGDPADPRMRAYIESYSPYQNVKPDVKMPPVLFITETSDDRVTPVFARMMAAKMEAQGHDVLFHEAAEGGHGPGATNAAQADMWALSYAYFADKLGLAK